MTMLKTKDDRIWQEIIYDNGNENRKVRRDQEKKNFCLFKLYHKGHKFGHSDPTTYMHNGHTCPFHISSRGIQRTKPDQNNEDIRNVANDLGFLLSVMFLFLAYEVYTLFFL